jgi:hypothetical protein
MDYESLRVGEIDPELNKVVTKMVIQHCDFVVYLDEELNTQWHVREREDPVHFGKVLNAVAAVELRSDFLRDDAQLFTCVRLLAGSIIMHVVRLSSVFCPYPTSP